MTPDEFATAYGSTALAVNAGTGISPRVLLAQWANETAWGTVVVGNNLGNIRCSSWSFCQYATLDEFAHACIATWHNGFYSAVLAAIGDEAQLAAVCASPWAGGHYNYDLHPFYDPLPNIGDEMTPAQDQTLNAIYAIVAGARLPSKAVDQQGADIERLIRTLPPGQGGTVNLAPVLAAIADLKAHPAAIADPSVLAIVTRIEGALKTA